MELRRASKREAGIVADLWLRSRRASIPANPPPIHPDDDVRRYFREEVFATQDVWVATEHERIVAMMAMSPGWIEHLHVEPGLTGRGVGGQLIGIAKREAVGDLELWTFQANAGARRFYERHGFRAVAFTEGDNEERAPDVRYRWSCGRPSGVQ
ncbi:MAG: GNAT family N-acetyltransferase [Acidimicrobiales bacterium]